jgi:hypothetical protein
MKRFVDELTALAEQIASPTSALIDPARQLTGLPSPQTRPDERMVRSPRQLIRYADWLVRRRREMMRQRAESDLYRAVNTIATSGDPIAQRKRSPSCSPK